MVLLGDEAHVDARFVHLEIVLTLTQGRLRNRCWTHPMDLLGDVGHVESRFSLFKDSVSVSAR
jgi:hypothetical protein